MSNQLDASLQKHVLTMLLFSDEARNIRSSIDIECWSSDPAILALARQVYNFIDTYHVAPKDCIYDLVSQLQVSADMKILLKDVIEFCDQAFPKLNTEWVHTRLDEFFRQSIWSDTLAKGNELLNQQQYDKIEQLMVLACRRRMETFDPGFTLIDVVRESLKQRDFPDQIQEIKLGFPGMDDRGIALRAKTLTVFVAPAKRGKSWALSYCGKRGMQDNKKTVHISLEMDQHQMGVRYLQSLNAFYTRRPLERQFARIQTDTQTHNYLGWHTEGVKAVPRMNDQGFLEQLDREYSTIKNWQNESLYIKQFPTKKLTVPGLVTYLDQLEQYNGFIPDMVVLDYADLMFTQPNRGATESRNDNTRLYEDLRGIAIERNLIMVTASQANREGAKTETDDTNISENYLKIATADLVIAINQKQAERRAGLVRLLVTNARNSEDKFETVVEQDLSIGQFGLNSQELGLNFSKQYKEILAAFTEA